MQRGMKIAVSALSVLVGLGVVASLILYAAMYEPWPVSTRQGPDTYFSRDLFTRHFPGTGQVSGIYAREEWGFGGDTVYSFRFDLPENEAAQQAVIDAITSDYSLSRLTEGEISGSRVLPAPDWFPPAEELHQLPEAYGRGLTFLWVDRPQPPSEEDESAEAAEGEESSADNPPASPEPAGPPHAYFQQANF